MKKKSKNSKGNKIVPKNNGTFCTECGDELQDFAFSKNSKDKNEIRKNHDRCIKTGKFSGEFCSKIFISDDSLLGDFLLSKD
jgi:predicted secreted acid phosphatase